MLYLLKLGDLETGDIYYKVGYSSRLDGRLSDYESCAPFIKLINKRDGEPIDEEILHRYLHIVLKDSYRFHKNEWYIIREQDNLIESEFLSPIEKMLEIILKDLIDNIEKDPDEKNSFQGILDDIHKGNIIPIRFRKSLIDSIKVRIKQSTVKVDNDEDTRFKEVINKIKSCRNFKEKLEFYCNLRSSFSINDQDPLNSRILEHFKNSRLEKYFSKFGLDGCREEKFNSRSLKKKLQNMTGECTELERFVHSYFHLGFYTLKDIKIAFSGIYRYFGIHKAPKATDILEYFNVQDKMVTDKETKKRVKGYELISIK